LATVFAENTERQIYSHPKQKCSETLNLYRNAMAIIPNDPIWFALLTGS
jgi:hypothetical protein